MMTVPRASVTSYNPGMNDILNDKELGKKMVEEQHFLHFARAYEDVTGERLDFVTRHERPDFICEREDGSLCGVELTQICRVKAHESLGEVLRAVFGKDRKRQDSGWQFADDTILVVQLMDRSLNEVLPALDDWLCHELAQCGFAEVWMADYTTMDTFREVQLFGVHPQKWRGRHPRANPDRKPYG